MNITSRQHQIHSDGLAQALELKSKVVRFEESPMMRKTRELKIIDALESKISDLEDKLQGRISA